MKYARIERERRFLLSGFPACIPVTRVRRIYDRYLEGTRLRLREVTEEGQPAEFKLAQKIPQTGPGAQQGFLTNLYLSREEYLVLARLPARELRKTRYSSPPFGIDVFDAPLEGLVLAEAEFESADAADALVLPAFVLREVSADERFTGGRLASAQWAELAGWLTEYGIR